MINCWISAEFLVFPNKLFFPCIYTNLKMKIYLADVEHLPDNTICVYSFSGRQLAIDKNICKLAITVDSEAFKVTLT